MSRIDDYRQRAADCLALAKITWELEEWQALIEIAASWHSLAVRLASRGDSTAPVEFPPDLCAVSAAYPESVDPSP
jgi:hypothetical protein